jgi:hypothetical protein
MLLKPKALVLFLLFYLAPFLVYVYFIITTLMGAYSGRANFEEMQKTNTIMMSIMGLLFLTSYIWKYEVAQYLSKLQPSGANMQLSKFQIAFGLSILGTLLYLGSQYIFPPKVLNHEEMMNSNFNPLSTVFQPAAILGMVSIIVASIASVYCNWFIAKSLHCAEVNEVVRSRYYAAAFFLLSVLVFGIWYLQPRIHDLMYAKGKFNPYSDDVLLDA